MPNTTITQTTLAVNTRSVAGPENQMRSFSIDPSLLKVGGGATNVLVVEVHQSTTTPDDSTFDVQLSGQLPN
jgi:hypothetical protein